MWRQLSHLTGLLGAFESHIHNHRNADSFHELNLTKNLLAHLPSPNQTNGHGAAFGFQLEQSFVDCIHCWNPWSGTTVTFKASPEAATWKASPMRDSGMVWVINVPASTTFRDSTFNASSW